ncbi:PREDICTED: uncharacterized protein DDB_G0271670-like [Nicotiana attenuata]|uniref:Herbivore elicitor-regulated 1 n=1 Tax=Nicotiana attenuata TaxID=49451 RepID=S5ZR43_NICAT|nr:PREDICTED: uncharacterized protein DDB_G0271670-like [Nicotiana attenuata]AGT40487.1 herbivore elicitor-regulated 1 [Nicotiana attenuata]OIT07218.1 hypothetical protein A4A49_01722 [Nicotiana attenuata]
MEIEVMMPSPAVDFNVDSGCTTPYMSAPSSPPRVATLFYSAPASPTRISSLYDEINFDPIEDDDFAFDFSGQLERISFSAADELFDGGKIKPLKPPPRFQYEGKHIDSPKSPKKLFKEAFSPRHKKKDFDPLAAALQKQSQTEDYQNLENSSSSREKGTRSLSPFRVSDLLYDQESNQQNPKKSASVSSSSSSSSSSSTSSVSSMISLWSKKWKLKDLFLFRSSSEGRASSTEQLNKYELLKKSHQEDVKNSSFRSTDSVRSRKKGPVSAHELHYTMNRAVSEEMKKKTYLPYKQGLLGCLGFNASMRESVSKSVANSMSMSRR